MDITHPISTRWQNVTARELLPATVLSDNLFVLIYASVDVANAKDTVSKTRAEDWYDS